MAKLTRDDIDKFFDYDTYLPTRTIYMGSNDYDQELGESGVDGAMAEKVIKSLHILDSSAPSGDKPITIIMNNIGGDEYHGMGIYDAIKACKNHVTIEVYGHCMSMGAVILQAADKRVMSPNARMMIHYGIWGVSDHPQNVYRWAEEGKKFDSWMENVFLEKIKEKNISYTLKQVQELCRFDTFLNSKEAVDLGLADSVLGED